MMIKTMIKDMGGIIRSPGSTLGSMMQAKRWAPLFLLILFAVALFTNITLSLDLSGMSADAQFPGYLPGEMSTTGSTQVHTGLVGRSFVTLLTLIMTALSFTVGAFFIYLFFAIGGTGGYYINYFTLVAGASLIDTLLPMIRDAISILTSTNLAVYSNLLFLFPNLSPHSFNYWLISQVDIFKVWYIIAIAAGVAVFAAKSLKRCLFISFLYFLFNAAVSAGFSLLAIRFASSMMQRM